MKSNFNFKSARSAARHRIPPRARALQSGMPEALDVSCPCCGALLKVDPETGSVVWVDKKKAPARDFDDLVDRVKSQKSILDEKFARSVHQTRHQREILEKKFEEARKRANENPDVRPPNPFDNE
jgi:hypothetical protein